MTRINACTLEKLSDELVRTEIMEIGRLLHLVKKRLDSGNYNFDDVPDTYRLGAGHVKFFYNKLDYIITRIKALHVEYNRRTGHYIAQDKYDRELNIYKEIKEIALENNIDILNDWSMSQSDEEVFNKYMINSKIPFYKREHHYFKDVINTQEHCDLYRHLDDI